MSLARRTRVVPALLCAAGTALTTVIVALIVATGDIVWYQAGGTVFIFGFQQALGWMPLLLGISVVGLACSVTVFFKPRLHPSLGMLVAVAGLAALPAGGGFVLGSVMALNGGVALVSPRTGKVVHAITLLAVAAAIYLIVSPLVVLPLLGLVVYAVIRRFRRPVSN